MRSSAFSPGKRPRCPIPRRALLSGLALLLSAAPPASADSENAASSAPPVPSGSPTAAEAAVAHASSPTVANISADEALITAASAGDVSGIEKALKAGASPNATDASGISALHHALRAGATPHAEADDAEGPLAPPAFRDDIACVKALLDAGADPNSCDPNGFTPLHACAVRDNVDTARILLVQGADIQARDTSLNTPLHVACTWGSRGIVDLLLDAGADINAAAHNGVTPLHAAQMWATDGNLACHLLDRGANPAPSAPCVFGSPLHMAVQGESENLVKRLLNAGVPVNAADPDGNTPLHAAAAIGSVAMVRLLLEHGADINLRNHKGESAADVVCTRCRRLLPELRAERAKLVRELLNKAQGLSSAKSAGEAPCPPAPAETEARTQPSAP